MSAFQKFCDDVGFGLEANQYIQRWHDENPLPSTPPSLQTNPTIPTTLLQSLLGDRPVIVTEGSRQRVVFQSEHGEETSIEIVSDDGDTEEEHVQVVSGV